MRLHWFWFALRGYALGPLQLLNPRTRPTWVEPAHVCSSRHAVQLCLARPLGVERLGANVSAEDDGQVFFRVDIIPIHVQPHFMAGRGRYPRAHFAFYYRQLLQKVWSRRVGPRRGINGNGPRRARVRGRGISGRGGRCEGGRDDRVGELLAGGNEVVTGL